MSFFKKILKFDLSNRKRISLFKIIEVFKKIEFFNSNEQNFSVKCNFSLILVFLFTSFFLIQTKAQYFTNQSKFYNAGFLIPVKKNNSEIDFNYNLKNSMVDSINIPLKRFGKLFLIEVTIDGQKGNLIFDTGANNLLLNRTYFRNTKTIGKQESYGITGGVAFVEKVIVKSLELFDLVYEGIKADITNLTHLENRVGVKVLGLIGLSLIRDFEIVIDYNNNLLQLYKLDKSGNRISPSCKNDQVLNQKIDFLDNIVFVYGKIGGKKLRFCLDTGAEMNSINSFSSKKVMNKINIKGRTILKGAGAENIEVLHGVVDQFDFEGKQISGMESIITDLSSLNKVYGIDIDGILGFSFLQHGIFKLNLIKKQIEIYFNDNQ